MTLESCSSLGGEVYEEIKKLTSKLEEKASTKSDGHNDIIVICIVGTRNRKYAYSFINLTN